MKHSVALRLAALLLLATTITLISSCGLDVSNESEAGTVDIQLNDAAASDPLATAAAQATAIVQQAQATAIILQAQSEAQATLRAAEQDTGEAQSLDSSAITGGSSPTAAASPVPTSETTAEVPVEVLKVGFAAEGGMIQVRFRAPVEVAERWLQTDVYVVDEETGVEYKEIPVMPRIGPLFGKPVREGQPGYFMLVNAPIPLQPGATVTVVLKDHVEQGIVVDG